MGVTLSRPAPGVVLLENDGVMDGVDAMVWSRAVREAHAEHGAPITLIAVISRHRTVNDEGLGAHARAALQTRSIVGRVIFVAPHPERLSVARAISAASGAPLALEVVGTLEEALARATAPAAPPGELDETAATEPATTPAPPRA